MDAKLILLLQLFTVCLIAYSFCQDDQQGLENETVDGDISIPVGFLLKKMAQFYQLQKEEITKLSEKVDLLELAQTNGFAGVLSEVNNKIPTPFNYNAGRYIYIVVSKSGHYKMTFGQGKAHCKATGGEIATYKQMQAAFKLGMQMCSCGWLSDGVARYPEQWPDKGCGGIYASPGIQVCGRTGLWNVFCYKHHYDGPITVLN